jgi:hypothetical protein
VLNVYLLDEAGENVFLKYINTPLPPELVPFCGPGRMYVKSYCLANWYNKAEYDDLFELGITTIKIVNEGYHDVSAILGPMQKAVIDPHYNRIIEPVKKGYERDFTSGHFINKYFECLNQSELFKDKFSYDSELERWDFKYDPRILGKAALTFFVSFLRYPYEQPDVSFNILDTIEDPDLVYAKEGLSLDERIILGGVLDYHIMSQSFREHRIFGIPGRGVYRLSKYVGHTVYNAPIKGLLAYLEKLGRCLEIQVPLVKIRNSDYQSRLNFADYVQEVLAIRESILCPTNYSVQHVEFCKSSFTSVSEIVNYFRSI